MLSLAQAQALMLASPEAVALNCRVVGEPSTRFSRVHSDTRSLRAGDLFVALRGEHFDAHDFLRQAAAAGAVACIAERGLGAQQPGLLVSNSLLALQVLARQWRQQFNLPLAAITGSNGKTTVTQMLAAIGQAALGSASLATAGNLNNHIGVPLTLLRLSAQHRFAVLELGTNHVGEIAQLAQLVQPTVALINNAQREHQEFLHGLQAVAQENGSVIKALPAGAAGHVVIPAADAFAPEWAAIAQGRTVWRFGLDELVHELQEGPNHVRGSARWVAEQAQWALSIHTPAGLIQTTLAQPGQHNVLNALAAATVALAAGLPQAAIAQGLAAFAPVNGRSRALRISRGGRACTLVDDSYNANPDSVRAAIDVLAALPGPRWLILGDMGEVGEQGPAFHAEVGQYARERGIETLWSAGALCAHLGHGRHFENVATLLAQLQQAPAATAAASILVKASRFMKMEQVVQALVAASQNSLATQATQTTGEGAHHAR